MKAFITSLLILFQLGIVLPVCAQGPKLLVENPDFNFGQAIAGEKLSHTFLLKNIGDAPLSINRVKSSCGCTAALLSSEVLAPGEQAEVEATFDSTRFRGAVVKTIYLYTDDPLNKVKQLYIRGHVKPELSQTPKRVEFKGLVSGVPKETRVVLGNQGKKRLTLSAPQATNPDISAELAKATLAPGESIELTIAVSPPSNKTRVSGYIIIKTDSENLPELRIPVYGRVNQLPETSKSTKGP